jgi:hypothetical protein
MLPIASSSGPAFIGVVVIGAALLLWWLLRGETRDEEAAKAEQEAAHRAEQEATLEAARTADEDRLSAP